jgi:2-polyprenyl-6-hydroxyphenyl methylase/3-demethylubiquinone-9 3-methyltransferase
MGQHALPEVRIGSILDEKLVEDLERNGGFDIVHSWGVLHHTGDMRKAIHQACRLVNQGGYFVCAIYRSHWSSPLWRLVKRGYNTLPRFLQPVLVILLYPVIFAAKWVATGSWPLRQRRGMDFYHNVVDWVGGYPYEYATVAQIEAIMSREGLVLKRVIPSNVPTGCNEFVFYKPAPPE